MAHAHRVTVQPATPADVPQLLAFVQGIAAFERLAHEVAATAEGLHEALFGAAPRLEALLAHLDGAPAGFATYFNTYSTFLARPCLYLEDIYVAPEQRRCGVGTALLRAAAAAAVERGCGRFEWAVLDWNDGAHRFYERLGAEALPQWRLYRVTGDALARLAAGEGA